MKCFSLMWIGLICLLTSAGCMHPEDNVVTPNVVEQGVVNLSGHPNINIIDVGLNTSPLKLGSVFVFDNPIEQWEVVMADDHNIFWRGSNGQTKLTTLSTILPALRWKGEDQSGRRVITAIQGSLHPLKKGNSMSFHVEALHTRPPGAFSGDWYCEVMGNVSVTVPVGAFDTWQVLCKVNGLEYLLANYSEQLGNNVRTIRVSDDNEVTVRQLVSSSLLKNKASSTGTAENK